MVGIIWFYLLCLLEAQKCDFFSLCAPKPKIDFQNDLENRARNTAHNPEKSKQTVTVNWFPRFGDQALFFQHRMCHNCWSRRLSAAVQQLDGPWYLVFFCQQQFVIAFFVILLSLFFVAFNFDCRHYCNPLVLVLVIPSFLTYNVFKKNTGITATTSRSEKKIYFYFFPTKVFFFCTT